MRGIAQAVSDGLLRPFSRKLLTNCLSNPSETAFAKVGELVCKGAGTVSQDWKIMVLLYVMAFPT